MITTIVLEELDSITYNDKGVGASPSLWVRQSTVLQVLLWAVYELLSAQRNAAHFRRGQ